MKHLFVFALLGTLPSFSNIASAQVGIGTTTPDPSAQLDIAGDKKGVLIPRMDLDGRNGIASPATGLMIYQTDNNPGFYFYNGTVWNKVGTAPAGFSAIGKPSSVVTGSQRISSQWSTPAFASGGTFDGSTSTFTVAESGYYRLSASINYEFREQGISLPTNSIPYVAVRNATTSQVYAKGIFPITNVTIPPNSKQRLPAATGTINIEGTALLNTGDVLELYFDQNNSSMTLSLDDGDNHPVVHWSALKIN
ncbi:hypothetical protein [Dyadobacter sp. 676]|uniref:C1q domain-containing protein n=1 Tax=Dyadobacter sp. 676 TaxID=3088362 RepID=A0AAU8FI70_9BACT